MPKKILLVDVSHLFFRAFYAFPQNLFDPEKRPINAVFGVAQMLLTAIEKEKPDYIFGGQDLASKTFRSEKLESYKGQRPELDPSLREQIPRVYELLESLNIPVFAVEGFEADDIIATLAEKYRKNPDFEVEILTGDADAFQLIGDNVYVLKPGKGENTKFDTDFLFEKKGIYPSEIIDFKGLAGDASDNLKGVVGIGEKGAQKLIREHGDLEGIYQALLDGKFKGAQERKLKEGKEDAFFTRDMATLVRDVDLDNFDLETANINNFDIQTACEYCASIGSNALQKRIQNMFLSESIKNTNRTEGAQKIDVQPEVEQTSMF